jgi:hypothetical protein
VQPRGLQLRDDGLGAGQLDAQELRVWRIRAGETRSDSTRIAPATTLA